MKLGMTDWCSKQKAQFVPIAGVVGDSQKELIC